ncbi:MAG: FliH/SctL family protein [Candidatus Adiutrix sp.]
MSDLGKYNSSRKQSQPDFRVTEFEPENFGPIGDLGPVPSPRENFNKNLPPKEEAPNPFEEFSVEQKPLSQLMDDLPSLAGLFKAFDLHSETPDPSEFQEAHPFNQVSEFVYEDMDLRDPNVVRTMAQAEKKVFEIINQAKKDALHIIESGRTEAMAIEAEATFKGDLILAETRRKILVLNAESEALNEVAASERQAALLALKEAEKKKTEAESQLQAAESRINGLNDEKNRLEEEFVARNKELEEEYTRLKTEHEAALKETTKTAQKQGYEEGLAQGLNEGRLKGETEARENFRQKVDSLIQVIEKINNIYDDLWVANGPMMIKLAIEAAEQIVNKELKESQDLATFSFLACIQHLSQANKVNFLVRSQDIAQLEQAKAEQRERLGALVKINFVPDDSLGPGDLIMESDVGRLDATIKYRTAQVMNVLRKAYAGAHDGYDGHDEPLGAAPKPEVEKLDSPSESQAAVEHDE